MRIQTAGVRTSCRQVCAWLALAGASILSACGDAGRDAPAPTSPTPTSTIAVSPTPSSASARLETPVGPEVLSTVGLYEKDSLTRIKATEATFSIEQVGGVDTLLVNGAPAKYRAEGSDTPEDIAANSSLSLVGAFELADESVVWAIVTGGTACPGTHVLVGARNGRALPGQQIPGCDDRGTMRRGADKITFEAGGSVGSYQDGLLTIESRQTFQ